MLNYGRIMHNKLFMIKVIAIFFQISMPFMYNLHLLSDAASFRAVTWTDTFSGTPPVSVNDTTGIVLQLYYDASADIWHVY